MKIFLIRHGMTDWNLKRKWQGTVDIELNDIGKEQARNLGKRFKREKYSKVYASPLSRAYNTALEISKNINKKPIIHEGLKEAHVELWNGYHIDEVKENFPEEFKLWGNDPWAYIKGVESMAEVQARGVKALKEIVNNTYNENVVIVSHALLIRSLICWVLNLPLNQHRNFMLDNASVTTIEFENNRYRLINLNETWHLDIERIIHPKTVEEEI
ncbi:hypothetical protein XO10_05270 [Marinitoga sp. 1135]|uniref:Fructose-2,6-bisphosphatase n=1 Tax=Marinitoga piezophila (strain DSM 14283 / JCM 11233 / KA3) TaxID=443254 RepID=H2J7Y6_MARPK|nr:MULTISPECIES: histidine phosphatase family protein [Marinitoga]AEX85477.1 fructose-2,6-bisphosphatase [Marinitoga piezophila KA3]NUU95691.1 hypothetical protein [Marinitoga sp. 1135]NUU97623.1 hypothetical protein [Marinitoga sp. 1138]